MRSLKKRSGVLDLTRLAPPPPASFSIAIPRYITNWMLTCGAQARAERRGIRVATSVAFLIFQFIFTSPSFVRPPSKMCVPSLTCISFPSRRDETARVLYVFTQSYLTHAFPWMCAAFQVPLAFHSPLFVCRTCSIFKLTWCLYCALMLSRSWSVHQRQCISAAIGRMFICFKHLLLFFCFLGGWGFVWLFFNHTIVSLMRLTSNCGAIIPPLTYFWQILFIVDAFLLMLQEDELCSSPSQ